MNRRRLLIFAACITLLAAAYISLNIFLNSIYRLPILMYHSIDYTQDKANRMTVAPEIFDKQMEYLRDNGYNVISLEKAVWYVKNKKRPPRKTVAITIDDGYKNNYVYAYPVLKMYNIPATIFVIVDFIGTEGFMSWDEVKELSDSGIIDIESHTMSHKMLPYLDDVSLKNELTNSKRRLEEKLGKEIRFLCYPAGRYDERVKEAVRNTGYEAAFATKPTRLGPNYDVYEIKRVRISPAANNLFVFAVKISGYHAFLRVIQNDYKDIPTLLWKRKSS